MHVIDFHAVGNEYTCDGNHPHVPCMHAGKESGKASALGRRELVAGLRLDSYVRYGMMGYVAWCFYLLVEVCIIMLIMQEILQPPESTVDRVLCQ